MNHIKVEIPYSEVLNNPQIQSLALSAVLGGGSVEGTTNGITTYNKISNNENTYALLTYDVIAYIVSLGGEVYNYQSYIEVDLNEKVPNYIRGSNELTWNEWLAQGQTPIEVDGKTYINGYAHYSGFKTSEKHLKHLTGTELTALINDGYTVLNKAQL